MTNNALRLLALATKQNYPLTARRVTDYAAERGVTLPFDLPPEYDYDAIQAAMRAGVPVGNQLDDLATERYRAESLGLREYGIDSLAEHREARREDYDLDRDQRDFIAERKADQGDRRLDFQETQGTTRDRQRDRALDIQERNGRNTGRVGARGVASAPPRVGAVQVMRGPNGAVISRRTYLGGNQGPNRDGWSAPQ